MAAVSDAEASAPAAVQSVDRALTILELLARDGEAGVTDIAAELGVHKSTAFRLLARPLMSSIHHTQTSPHR